jgi:thiamine-monophosphate kinase
MTSELETISSLTARLPRPPAGETWIGDDMAVVARPEAAWILLSADAVVAGVHADLRLTTVADLGWKAMVANLSDVAAMGGTPGHALVTVAAPPDTDIDGLYDGIIAAAESYACPVVGGDLSSAPVLVVTVAVTGTTDRPAILRSGARPGDEIWVTGPLGAAAAGLRLLRSGARDEPGAGPLVRAHARPRPLLAEGAAARAAGATAMIDVSDGLASDLSHIADASGAGFELDTVPVAPGATEEEALGGGEDYQLVFTVPGGAMVGEAFATLTPPTRIGTVVADRSQRVFRGEPLLPVGWRHQL